jgi:hypothetical protein
VATKARKTKADYEVGAKKCNALLPSGRLCGHVGPWEDFVPNPGSAYGIKPLCKACSGKRRSAGKYPAGDVLPTIGGCDLTPTSLSVRGGKLRAEAWEGALQRVARLERGSQWWLGDLLAFGEEREYGETYTAAIEATRRSLQTLKNYSYVSRNVPARVRRPDLPWRSHRLVASLSEEDQDLWLGRASDGGWSSDELQRELREAGAADKGGDDFPDADPDAEPEFRCPECGHEWDGDARPEPQKKAKLKAAA